MWPSSYDHLLHDQQVVGSNHGRVMPKTVNLVPAAFLPGACIKIEEQGSKHGELPVD